MEDTDGSVTQQRESIVQLQELKDTWQARCVALQNQLQAAKNQTEVRCGI